jgi:dihydropteroate synthase
MGIVNVTPDSFSDGGAFLDAERAVAHALALVAQGADILDVGGESTRPGARPVSAAEEAARVLPVIEGIRRACDCCISVDTSKAEVAALAIQAGADMINDISGLTFDPRMPSVAAEADVGLVVMHIRGEPRTMQDDPRYEQLFEEVRGALAAAVARAEAAGLARERVWIDPGIGFGKALGHNLELMRRTRDLEEAVGRPVLVGPSRKSFIGQVLDQPDPSQRLMGTAAAVASAVHHGARCVRVHDVAAMRDVVRVTRAIEGGPPPWA